MNKVNRSTQSQYRMCWLRWIFSRSETGWINGVTTGEWWEQVKIFSVAVVLFRCDLLNQWEFQYDTKMILSHLDIFDACQTHSPFYSHNHVYVEVMRPEHIANYFGHDNSERLTWFYRCSSCCINGLISPQREVQNILFIWHNKVWPIQKPPRKITCFEVIAKFAFKGWLLHEIWTRDIQDIVI